MPAPPPDGYDTGGGVYGITVTNQGRVFWLSAYLDQSAALDVEVECGGAGGSATLCEPSIDEPTTMLVDRNGTFWLGGLTFDGGGAIVTSTNASITFDTAGVMQILNGPKQAVWGVLADFTQQPPRYSVAEFAVSGTRIVVAHKYVLPSGDSIASMTFGGDGGLWFADYERNAIGRMDASGSVREFALHSPNSVAQPWYGQWQIATACDGAVWFTEPGPNKIARIDARGAILEFPLPSGGAQPTAIASVHSATGQCTAPELWVGEQQRKALAAVAF